MTGSLENARMAYSIDANYGVKRREFKDKKWSFIGSGGTRSVYLGPDGVAYKVGDPLCNLAEARASRKLRNNKKLAAMDTVVPAARTYKVNGDYYVLAMDYIPTGEPVKCSRIYNGMDSKCNCRKFGTPRLCFADAIQRLSAFGIEDMFSANIIYSTDRRFYLIDLGFQDYDYPDY